MAKSTIKLVTGVAAINRAFKELPLKFQKKALRPALREASKIVAARAKQNIPVNTGKAKKSIKVRAIKRSRVKLGVGIAAGDDYNTEGLPYYVKWLEFGTKERYTKAGAYRGRIRPGEAGGFIGLGKRKGFLRISLHDSRKEANKVFIEKMRETLLTVKPVT